MQRFAVSTDLPPLPEDPALLQHLLREAQAEITRLQMLIAVLLRNRFGRRSERLGEEALQQGVEDVEQSLGEQEAKIEAAQPAAKRPATPPKRNRGSLPKHLPRVEVVIDIADKTCACCGAGLHTIGEDRAEMLDYVPAQIRVQVIRRPRYGCRACEGAIVQAPAPERPIDGGMATEALLAHVLVNKYADHLPLYRQSQIFARQGVDLDRSTLCNWVGRACWWLEPLYELLLSTVLSSPKVVADDTTLPVLDPGRGRTKTGRLWCYAVDNRPWSGPGHPAAVYAYSEDRKVFRGLLQVDGYAGFGGLVSGATDQGPTLAFPIRDANSTTFTSQRTRRLPMKPCNGSVRCMRSRLISEDKPRSNASRSAMRVAVRWSRRCTPGCPNCLDSCPAGRAWRRQSVTLSITGRA